MSTQQDDYSAPTVSEYNLDPGGNYVSPASEEGTAGVLSGSIIE